MPEEQILQNQAPVQEPVQEQEQGEKQHSSGYFDSTYRWQSSEVEEVPQAAEPDSNFEELGKKLGIDPETLGKSPEELEKEAPPEEKLSPEDWYKQQFGTAEAQQFADNFKKHLGIDIKEAYELINNTAQVTQGLEQWRREVHTQRELEQLRTEFGNEFDSIMPQVAQEFQRIRQVNPQQAAALDNIDGARYLAAYIRQRGGMSQNTQPLQQRTDVPSYALPNVRQRHGQGTPPAPTIRMSEFIKWSDEEVQSRYKDISLARQMGTFIYDV